MDRATDEDDAAVRQCGRRFCPPWPAPGCSTDGRTRRRRRRGGRGRRRGGRGRRDGGRRARRCGQRRRGRARRERRGREAPGGSGLLGCPANLPANASVCVRDGSICYLRTTRAATSATPRRPAPRSSVVTPPTPRPARPCPNNERTHAINVARILRLVVIAAVIAGMTTCTPTPAPSTAWRQGRVRQARRHAAHERLGRIARTPFFHDYEFKDNGHTVINALHLFVLLLVGDRTCRMRSPVELVGTGGSTDAEARTCKSRSPPPALAHRRSPGSSGALDAQAQALARDGRGRRHAAVGERCACWACSGCSRTSTSDRSIRRHHGAPVGWAAPPPGAKYVDEWGTTGCVRLHRGRGRSSRAARSGRPLRDDGPAHEPDDHGRQRRANPERWPGRLCPARCDVHGGRRVLPQPLPRRRLAAGDGGRRSQRVAGLGAGGAPAGRGPRRRRIAGSGARRRRIRCSCWWRWRRWRGRSACAARRWSHRVGRYFCAPLVDAGARFCTGTGWPRCSPGSRSRAAGGHAAVAPLAYAALSRLFPVSRSSASRWRRWSRSPAAARSTARSPACCRRGRDGGAGSSRLAGAMCPDMAGANSREHLQAHVGRVAQPDGAGGRGGVLFGDAPGAARAAATTTYAALERARRRRARAAGLARAGGARGRPSRSPPASNPPGPRVLGLLLLPRAAPRLLLPRLRRAAAAARRAARRRRRHRRRARARLRARRPPGGDGMDEQYAAQSLLVVLVLPFVVSTARDAPAARRRRRPHLGRRRDRLIGPAVTRTRVPGPTQPPWPPDRAAPSPRCRRGPRPGRAMPAAEARDRARAVAVVAATGPEPPRPPEPPLPAIWAGDRRCRRGPRPGRSHANRRSLRGRAAPSAAAAAAADRAETCRRRAGATAATARSSAPSDRTVHARHAPIRFPPSLLRARATDRRKPNTRTHQPSQQNHARMLHRTPAPPT